MPTPIRSRSKWMKLTSPEMLRAFMKKKGVGYKALADMVGCHKSFISHLAKGRKTTCGSTLAGKIEGFLDAPKGLLFVERASTVSGQNINTQRRAA